VHACYGSGVLWPSRAARVVREARIETREVLPGTTIYIPSRSEFAAYNELYAMQVPALARGVKLISGTVAQLPLEVYEGTCAVNLRQPEPDRARWVTIQRTVQDLIMHGRAYWRWVSPTAGEVAVLPASTVTEQADGTLTTSTGEVLQPSDPTGPPIPGRVIIFTGFADGVLLAGSDTIQTALALELATRTYAETPAPQAALQNTSNYELSDAEVDELLAGWKEARQNNATAYLNGGIELKTLGFDAVQTALVEQRNQSAIAVARLLNLDAMWVGASVGGSSLTYQNRVDARTDLYGLTLSDYILAIEQRLGMPDCGGAVVAFSSSEFLRANLEARATMAIDLFTAGLATRDEARAFIADEPTGGIT
jgi:HK97 family phage portal protein